MKTRYSSLDVCAIVPELKAKICTGWRVNQIYDCDNKTFLFKLNKSIVQMKKDEDPVDVDEEVANKLSLIVESGIRIHTTDYNWNKSHAPGNFVVKLRKHLRNKRIVNIRQLGKDRSIELQIGTGEVTNFLILELYDKGNIILTDNKYNVLTVLRWRKPTSKPEVEEALPSISAYDSENLKVGEPYPHNLSRRGREMISNDERQVFELLYQSKTIMQQKTTYKKRGKLNKMQTQDSFPLDLKQFLNPYVDYGSNLLEDKLLKHVFDDDIHSKCTINLTLNDGKFDESQIKDLTKKVIIALQESEKEFHEIRSRDQSPGYLIQKEHESEMCNKINPSTGSNFVMNIDFFPLLSCALRKLQIEGGNLVYKEFESFDRAVDIYFSNLESQRLDSKALVAEKDALKKLENLKIDHQKRLDELASSQLEDEKKGRLIELNHDIVEQALNIIQNMVARQMPWSDIKSTVKEAQRRNDPIASLITELKLDRNQFSMRLSNPYDEENSDNNKSNSKIVDIDIGMSTYANATRFFSKRRVAIEKEQKTKGVSKKAFKNVEKRTKEMLKDVVIKTNITKARKRYWFENFHWFISSDGYLVVAGRDAEQNDSLVKRYMKNNDIYVHADLHGAATVIIKNEFPDTPIPPKTLTEAGTMAVCYSSAWDAKIAIASWWVYPNQVSKSAPTGEYLTTGAFIIRGKKNYLPISYLVLGFGFIFKLDNQDDDGDTETKEYRLIDTITNDPKTDDVLLYAVPICGPYAAFQNFKYKVKVIPGTTKRGKAAKSILGVFLHDKTASARERELLRVYKDQDFGRDLPSKVKISAANLIKLNAANKKKAKTQSNV